jgi:RHS repeat-associated protein
LDDLRLSASDSFAQSSYVRWSVSLFDSSGRTTSSRQYHLIPASGDGVSGTNYDETTFGDDALGRQNMTESPGGTITRTVFDARGNAVKTYVGINDAGATDAGPTGGSASGNNMVLVTEYEHDSGMSGGDGLPTKTTQWVDAAISRTSQYAHDWRGSRTTTDGEVDYFEKVYYDNLGHVVKTERYNTTAADNLIARSETSYDVLGRTAKLTSFDHPTVGSGSIDNEVLFAYNAFGQITHDYQEHGGAVNTSTSPKVQFAYANGAAGHVRPTSVTYPNGRMLNFSYGDSGAIGDVIHRVAALVDNDGSTHLADYAYLGFGAIVNTDYPQPNVSQNLAFGTGSDPYDGLDRFGRTVDHLWRNNANSTDLVRIQHGYDRAGNRLWRQDAVSAAQSPAVYMDELYSYDGVNQLTAMQRGQLNAAKTGLASGTKSFGESWSLDMTGNWGNVKQDTNGDGTWELDQARTHDAANEIATIAGLTTHVAHDRAGNMPRLPKPDNWAAHFDLTYDAWNRLVKVVDGTSTVAEYRYDGRNFRIVKKTYAGGTLAEIRHYFYNSDWQCLEDRLAVVSSGVLSSYADRQHVWGLRYVDDLVLRDRNADGLPTSGNLGFTGSGLDERLYCHQDPNWNVVALTNSSGAIVERYGYSAYGKAMILTASFAARATSGYAWDSLYTGRQYDVETGLYHYRNRYYAAEMGRFVNRDPIGYRGGIDLYRYVHDNPLIYTDPSGMDATDPLAPTQSHGKGAEWERYWEWWKKQHPNLTDEQLEWAKEQLTRGCVGVTVIHLGHQPQLNNCYSSKWRAEKNQKCMEDGGECCPGSHPRIFSVHYYSPSGAFPPDGNGKVDMRGWNPGTAECRPGGTWDNNGGGGCNFDFGWLGDDGFIYHANHYYDPTNKDDPAYIYKSNLKQWCHTGRNPELPGKGKYFHGYPDFDGEVWCVECGNGPYKDEA